MIEEIIKPETDLEKQLTSDPELIAGLEWGKPRNGHPEGLVIYHVEELLKNIDTFFPEQREELRLIAIIHDAFKYKVDRGKTREGENHHGMIARRFAERYITNPNLLDVIELHDDAYNCWCKGIRTTWEKAEERANKLIQRLGGNINLYLAFYFCDNYSGKKEATCYSWFNNFVHKK